MEPLQILNSFKLEELDELWVTSVWDSGFLTSKSLPDEYSMHLDSEDVEVLLKDSYLVIKNWASEGVNDAPTEGQRSEVSWQTLIGLNVNTRSLLALLGYLIHNGHSADADEDSRQACLKATSLYFALLAVPGSNAFRVFHSALYHMALETFQLSEHLATRFKKRGRALDLEDLYEPKDNTGLLGTVETLTLTKGLNSAMFDLITVLKSFCMRDQIGSLEITVHSLLKVAILETDMVLFEPESMVKDASLASLSYNAYMALQELCNPRHGPVDMTVKLIAKYMLPYFLTNHGALPNRALVVVRETMVRFVKNLMTALKNEAQSGIATLIQHLLAKCPERAEARQKQAVIVIKLINSCEENMYMEAVQNLVLLAHHNRVTCRIFAQEIIGKFLAEAGLSMRLEIKKLLMATVLGRCMDTSNMVRGKAMATVADCTDVENNVALTTILEIFEGSAREKPLPNLELLKQAIGENIDPLPGSNTIVSLLIARVEDERALVRRSALQALGNLVSIFPGLLDSVVPPLGIHCRDPALVVRRFAIQILSQLLVQFPDHPNLADEWVGNVLPQIFDVEVKVQEKALQCLKELMLDNISHVSNGKNDALANLPWVILNRLAARKMRKHLSKACNVWEKTDVIRNSLIRNIQSHLLTDNDIPAWVLLAACAENTDLTDLDSHYQNYEELLRGETFQACLALEVLRSSWKNLGKKFLRKLEPDLFKYLSQFRVNFGLISVCLDILMSITKHLNPDNGEQLVQQRAKDLMKQSEVQLEKIINNETETIYSPDLYRRAMCTLGNASHLCTRKISSLTLCALQGLVLPDLPTELRYKELRAAAVALLGQQAMRDRKIAKEITPILGNLMRKKTNSDSQIEAAVKINAAKALADICVRFTALVERYLPDMCISMKDPNPVVREVIVVLFIELLLEDYIKVKGPFFFHILTMLTDTDDMIRELTVFVIKERLLVKNKTLISQQFLESIFHYNNYKLCNKFSSHSLGDKERNALTLPDRRNQKKRRIIYNFMLDHLDPASKLKLLKRLTGDVLGGVTNGTISVDTREGLSVVKDTLYVLSRDQLQPASCTKRTEDDGLDEAMPVEVPLMNNTMNAIVEGMKKHGLNVLIPTLISLEKTFHNTDSVLKTDVRRLLLKLISEQSKEQLANIYNEHPELEKEIECDSRQYRRTAPDDEGDSAVEEESPAVPSNQSKQSSQSTILLKDNRLPKIVLRRLSTLTYPGISNWRSPSQSGGLSPQPGPSGSQRSLTSPVSRQNSPPEPPRPGSSNTTPTSSRPSYSLRSSRYSPILSSGHSAVRSRRERRLSTLFDDNVKMPGYLEMTSLNPRVLLQDIGTSTPNIGINNVMSRGQLTAESDSD